MNNSENSALRTITSYRQILSQKGFTISETKKEGFAFSVLVSNGMNSAKLLVYFGKKGTKPVIQSSDSKLSNEIRSILFGEKLFDNLDDIVAEPEQYIGIDESGKGDYFGPLVIAGVFVDKFLINMLRELNVKDSKLITDYSIKIIASEIKKVANTNFEIIIINPEKYNQLHSKFGNLNRLLGWAHSRVIENLAERTNAKTAISDKFGNENLIRNALMEKGREITLHQIIKAEKYTAVAAASILAREKVIDWFYKTSSKYKLTIPKGASENVNKVARTLKQKLSEEEFKKLVKFHFKNSGLLN